MILRSSTNPSRRPPPVRGRLSEQIDDYARAVVEGCIPAGKYHRLACVRHQRDRAREGTDAFPYVFDDDRADRFVRFAEKLRHYKGELAGTRIVLQPYQRFRLGSIFGWVHRDTGFRRFRTAYNEIPRKNGKSLEAAIVATYATFFDGEPGAEGYTIATKREQAKIVFNDAKQLVESSPDLKRRISAFVANLSRASQSQKLEPLGADRDSTDGLNPHLIIVDEFHAQKNRGLIDVMETATGARRQPLNFQITTAGNDPMSPCGDQHDYAVKILDGVWDDDTFFAFIAHADADDDWLDETTWRKANPNFGVSVRADDLHALATKARHMPASTAAFKQKRLNVWVNVSAPWLSIEGWRAGQTIDPWPDDFLRGRACWIGVDLSSKIDLAAVAAVFPPIDDKVWRVRAWMFTPDESLNDRALRDRAPYRHWQALGYLFATPGNRIDQDAIRDHIRDVIRPAYDVRQIGFDPWNAGNLEKNLQGDGFDVVEIPQTMAHMSGPSKEFEADVLDGLVDANANPVLGWMASNVVVQRDNKDNIYPVKKHSRGRIDGIIATLIARKLAGTDAVVAPEPQYQMMVFG
jgi:phage terminase large subunit-like protein